MKLLIVVLGLLYAVPICLAQDIKSGFGFIQNNGQVVNQDGKINSEVLYLIPVNQNLNVQLRAQGFSYDVFTQKPDGKFEFNRVDVDFENCNPNIQVEAENPLDDYVNFYTAGIRDNSGFKTTHYQTIRYKNVYDGIDLEFQYDPSSEAKMKFNFILSASANIDQIELKYSGFNSISVNETIQLELNGRNLTESIPLSWYSGTNDVANVNYELVSNEGASATIKYQLEDKTKGLGLVIDPMPDLDWATYYGDSLIDVSTDVMTDNWGFVYITGYTQSFNNLATSGVHQDTLGGMLDAYVTKFNAYGSKIWSTYYGGTGTDLAYSIMVDTFFHVSITGVTDSPNGIASDSAYQLLPNGGFESFVAKFDDSGQRIWSSYFGGSGDEIGTAIDTDYDGLTYIVGTTEGSSGNIASTGAYQPTNAGGRDGFLVKFDSLGFPLWSTYYGGPSDDSLSSVAVEWSNIIVAGTTNSSSGIHTNSNHQNTLSGATDAYLAKFSQQGILEWGTYFGGPEMERGNDVEIYNSRIYMVGATASDTMIITQGALKPAADSVDAFVTKFDTLGNQLWGTYYGGFEYDEAVAVSVELDSNVYIFGNTYSDTLIASLDAEDTTYNGNGDAFLAKFHTIGFFQYATYFGGDSTDILHGGDIYGNTAIYISGLTASTGVSHQTSVQGNLAGQTDAFLAKYITEQSTQCNGGTCAGGSTGTGIPQFCHGPLTFYTIGGALGVGANWVWYEGGCGAPGVQLGIGDTLVYTLPVGIHTIYVRAEGVNNATECSDFTIEVVANPVASILVNDTVFCVGDSLSLQGTLGDTYSWTGPNGFSSSNQNDFIDSLTLADNGEFIMEVTNGPGCSDKDTVNIVVHDIPSMTYTTTNTSCAGSANGSIDVIPTGLAPFIYNWNPAVDTTSFIDSLMAGVYFLVLSDSNQCSISDSIYVTSPSSFIQSVSSTPNDCLAANGTASASVVGNPGDYSVIWMPSGETTLSIAGLLDGDHIISVTDSLGCENLDTVNVGYQNNLMAEAVIVQDIICANETNGVVGTNVLSGEPTYTYLWQTGETTSSISGVGSGSYSVEITDAFGCVVADTVTLSSPPPIIVQLDSTLDDHCNQGIGAIYTAASGGNGTLSFAWDPGSGTSNNLNGIMSGTYVLNVEDDSGCTASLTASIADIPGPTATIVASTYEIDAGQDVTMDAIVSPALGTYTFSWEPSSLVDCPSCQSVISTPNSTSIYTVTVIDEYGCSDTAQMKIFVIPCGSYFLPTIFSPNGDDLNDEWNVMGQCISSFQLSVFNRWGEVIFNSVDLNSPWDGTYKGSDVDVGTYVFQLEIEFENGERDRESGSVKVAR